ncbi:UNVERIFIED_CONTAM: hypothetical protein RMT77_001488 [Armadillidium vulgare]
MKCYYEVLGVTQDVCDEDLRKSYRRLALQFHPDKNPNNEEEAKAKFQEIQNAYEVLSDPQERAFYDRNRDSILHGEEDGSALKEEIHLYKYFCASCYTGFDDSERGFYTVYRRAFESIAAKDMKYMDEEEEISIPNFGRSDTDLEDVAIFYAYWQSYCTSMSFCWFDKYDIRQATKRWVEKQIEKENKKIRDKAKKEFNEEVRSLVSFVRKRDKRWEARKKLLEDKVAENARKQQEYQERQRELRRKKVEETMEKQKENILQYERKLKEMESHYDAEWGIVSDDDLDEAESEGEEEKENVELMMEGLYCVACEKLFKSEKAFINHENSRKHKERQASLASFMKEEELAYGGEEENHLNHDVEEKLSSLSSGEEAKVSSSSRKKKKKKKKLVKDILSSESTKTESTRRKSKNNKQTLGEDLIKLNLSDDDSKDEETESKSVTSSHVDTVSNEAVGDTVSNEGVVNGSSITDDVDIKKQKLKGKKAKDTKKKLQQKNNDSQKVENVCSVCNEKFESKNKLFSHLRSSGHAIVKVQTSKKKKK